MHIASRRVMTLLLLVVTLALGAVGAQQDDLASPAASAPSGAPAFSVALIGDLPYTLDDDAKFPNLIAAINAADPAFVIHDGDFKCDPRCADGTASRECSDALYAGVRVLFDLFTVPLIYTPGDNEWTDCWQPPANADPLDRLARLRDVFFATEASLGGRTLPLVRQSADDAFVAYRENARWTYGGVLFLTLHVVGSNNNQGRTPAMDAEWAARTAADLAWLRAGFAEARATDAPGVVVTWQANPWDPRIPADSVAFTDLLATLEAETLTFDRPVLLVHGDTHFFRVDKPLGPVRGRVVEHFTRVETFGTPNVHWVELRVDPADPELFTVRSRLVPANIDPR